MRFLHTSDWHLGQKFLSSDRYDEHREMLDWLLRIIEEQAIDVLLVAGDIFDIGSPPNKAQELYYEFLARLQSTSCKHVVITGGNHDSPSLLNASRTVLQFLNIQVVGALDGRLEDCILALPDEAGNTAAVVAAVPFLRDRDLRMASSGETSLERIDQIRSGIRNTYQQAGALAEALAGPETPVLAMGHLYAAGSEASDKQDNIYLGDTINIKAAEFPAVFDYVALGHIHRPQAIGGLKHIRYCGSPLPLSFSEILDDKKVVLIEFSGKTPRIKEIPAPLFRRLKTVSGSIEEVKQRLQALEERHRNDPRRVWVEVLIETDTVLPGIEQDLYDWVKGFHMDLLKIRILHGNTTRAQTKPPVDLDDLQPREVFERRCLTTGSPPEDYEELLQSFLELENWLEEQEETL
jgi:exonuclease SbcD